MPIECEFCNGKVERSNREEHATLCEKRPQKCAAPNCEFESADREAFAKHIANVHREHLIRNYANLFREDTREEATQPRVVEASAEDWERDEESDWDSDEEVWILANEQSLGSGFYYTVFNALLVIL